MTDKQDLPPLPPPHRHSGTYESAPFQFYTEDQVCAYALEAIRSNEAPLRVIIEEQRRSLEALNDIIGGPGSTTLENVRFHEAKAPQGWKLVPRRITDKMLSAAQSAWLRDPLRRTTTFWDAALAAAPTPEAGPPKWIDFPDSSGQGLMLNPEWLKLHGMTAQQAQFVEASKPVQAEAPSETLEDAKEALAELFFQCARYERPSTDWRAALDEFCARFATHPEQALQAGGGDTVALPTNEEQAELMAKVGMAWLHQHAPHRLKFAPPAQQVDAPSGVGERTTSVLGWPMTGLKNDMTQLRKRWEDMKALGNTGAGQREADRFWGPVALTTMARYFEEIDAALSAQPAAGVQKPDGRLHADGYFTWNTGKRLSYRADLKLPCDFYLGPQPEQVAQDSRITPGVVYVCDIHDRECGDRPAGWCDECPKGRAARTRDGGTKE